MFSTIMFLGFRCASPQALCPHPLRGLKAQKRNEEKEEDENSTKVALHREMSLTFRFCWQIFEARCRNPTLTNRTNQAITVNCTTWNLRTKRTRWHWQSTAWSELERLPRRWTSKNDIGDWGLKRPRMGQNESRLETKRLTESRNSFRWR